MHLSLQSEHVEKSSGFLPLMGGKIEDLGDKMIGIDDGVRNLWMCDLSCRMIITAFYVTSACLYHIENFMVVSNQTTV